MSPKEPAKSAGLDEVIEKLTAQLAETDPKDDKYAKMVEQLTKLHALKEKTAPRRVSPDTWAIIGANIVGILILVSYERTGIITSKALAFVIRPKSM